MSAASPRAGSAANPTTLGVGSYRAQVGAAPRTDAGIACLSVVIPCYNEVSSVAAVIERVLAAPATHEVIVVDDGSIDGTRDVLAGLDDPRLRVLLQPENQGKGAAVRRGFTEATAPFVVVQDADLEYDPDDFPILLAPLLDGSADVVFGSRFMSSGAHRVLYFWHYVGNRLLTTLSNMLTNLNLTDMETCYKVFRREVIQGLELREDRFGFEPEVTARLAQGDYRIFEVGISYAGRTYAEGKKIGWRDGVRALYCIARYSNLGSRAWRAVRPGVRPPRPNVPVRVVGPSVARPDLDLREGSPDLVGSTSWVVDARNGR